MVQWTRATGPVLRKDEARLPQITSNGDVLILRKLKITEYAAQTVGLSSSSTIWVVLPLSALETSKRDDGTDIKHIKCAMAGDPTPVELSYAKAIWQLEPRSSFGTTPKPASVEINTNITADPDPHGQPVTKPRKFRLVRDLHAPARPGHNVFANLLGEVRKLFSNDYRVELQLTDYTHHPLLYNYSIGCDENRVEGDEFGYTLDKKSWWPGPWGQMTIQINLWDAHASFARKDVKEGAYVFLQNVHLKLDRGRRVHTPTNHFF